MGKISDKDFAEMSGRLRLRATRILRQIDAGSSYRDRIEREVARRLGSAATTPTPSTARPAATHNCGACGKETDLDARFCKHCGASTEQAAAPVPTDSARTCATCGKDSDLNARFCKHCGASLESGR
jgi:membrane protease subunit (stomatin/prohibitin family)